MCSAVFITGLDPAVAAESLGYFVAPYAQRKLVGTPVVDRVKKEVRIAIPNGPTLTARHFDSQGCITLPPGKDDVFFKPSPVKSALADASTLAWPMGDVLPTDPLPAEVNDPDFDPNGTYPDHIYFYTGRIDAFNYAATRPQQWPPNTVGRYRNTDPVLANYLVRLAAEKRGEDYFSFPQRNVFDKIGIRSMVIETDPYGNFLTQGYDFMSARDWARLGNLYLQDGVWNGERILPEGFVNFVSTVAPAWAADKRPIYGAFFWINGTGTLAVPTSAYYMLGAAGQFVVVVPSHDLVVVRIGYSKGERFAGSTLNQALTLLTSAVPRAR